MNEPVRATREQTPEDVARVLAANTPHVVFAAGDAVPGLSSWLLECKIGGGGFGEVWLAKHAWDAEQKPRAVKFCTDPAARHRLVTHEQNVVRRVMKYAGKHPHIVPLLDCNLEGTVPWLMYEYVEGGTLADAMQEWRGLELPKRLGRAVRALHAIAGALAACHRLDPPLVHRDLKPQNVLMAGGMPRITDFGIGSVVVAADDPATAGQTAYATRLPSALHRAGTRLYAPPEQMLGATPHPRDDVHALGVIAYQMIVGDMRFAPGPDATAVLRDLKVPTELVSLIVNSVALIPERRPKDANEWEVALIATIERAQQKATVTSSGIKSKPALPSESLPFAEPVAEPARRSRLLPWAASAVLLAMVCATGLYLAAPKKQSDTPESTNLEIVKAGSPEPKEEPKSDEMKSEKDGAVEPKPVEPPKSPSPKPGETREFPLPDGLKMTFCWVPSGECQLGSPKGEVDGIYYSPRENEEKRGKFKTNGFWLGKYEVTQAEWAVVMRGTNLVTPSYFRVGGKGADELGGTTDTSLFPVESVSWDMICDKGGFLDKLNALEGRKAFGSSAGPFALPHEDAWEYACRGGLGNGQPFYFGKGLNGTQANMWGEFPFGTETQGPYLKRPTQVGAYATKFPHPWGLCDMHGNVWEWCENLLEPTKMRARRGGSWSDFGVYCRAAQCFGNTTGQPDKNLGLRLFLSLN